MRLEGERELHARLRAMQRAPEGLMRTVGLTAIREQKALAPVRTGNLRRTIHLGSLSASHVDTVASAKYARAVEYGTGPHIIVPRRRKVLRFSVGGRVVYTTRVRHPGTAARPFMEPGLRKAAEGIGIQVIVDAWNGAA